MNERIKELAKQARNHARNYVAECKHYGYYMEHNEEQVRFEEKFAELIVKECVEKLKETKKVELPFLQAANEHVQELPLSVYITELNTYFRVEE